jgi:hypothetical protein
MLDAPLSCLTCRERVAYRRGVCPRCYSRHKLAVAGGKATWAALEAAGLVLSAHQHGKVWRYWNLSTPKDPAP